MTPKEKAIELVDKFKDYANDFYTDFASQEDLIYNIKSNAKECALIAVDEILSFIEDDRKGFSWKTYYLEVKKEIEKI